MADNNFISISKLLKLFYDTANYIEQNNFQTDDAISRGENDENLYSKPKFLLKSVIIMFI